MFGYGDNPFGFGQDPDYLTPEDEEEEKRYIVSSLPDPEDWLEASKDNPDPVSAYGDPEDYDPGEQEGDAERAAEADKRLLELESLQREQEEERRRLQDEKDRLAALDATRKAEQEAAQATEDEGQEEEEHEDEEQAQQDDDGDGSTQYSDNRQEGTTDTEYDEEQQKQEQDDEEEKTEYKKKEEEEEYQPADPVEEDLKHDDEKEKPEIEVTKPIDDPLKPPPDPSKPIDTPKPDPPIGRPKDPEPPEPPVDDPAPPEYVYDPNESEMAGLIEALERSRRLNKFDYWGGGADWGVGSTDGMADTNAIEGMVNMAMASPVIQNMQGLPPSLQARLRDLGPISGMDIAGLGAGARGTLADVTQGALTWMENQEPGWFSKALYDTGIPRFFGANNTEQQIRENYGQLASSGIGQSIIDDAQFAADKLAETRSEVQMALSERPGFGAFMRKTNPLLRW